MHCFCIEKQMQVRRFPSRHWGSQIFWNWPISNQWSPLHILHRTDGMLICHVDKAAQ